ncbi:signal transduction histidine kinase [Rhizobium leguminosarum]
MAEHCSILIIDDNIDDREVYRRILGRVSSTAYTVVEAETGEEGLALNGRKRPDCILLDYSLPGRDGLGVLADILEDDPAANVIMLTGQGNETVAVEVMKSGARDYLTKDSLSPETLHRCIQNAIMHGMLEAKLEQKRQSLEIFTRAMAHDLKEPLRTIKSFSRILHGSAALPAEDRELLDYVLSAADHMEDLIVKVSGFTKLEAYGGLELRPVSLSAVLDQVEDNLRQQTESRGAVIIRGALPEVMGDATLLTQLLQNLVSNAIRYCEQKVPEISIIGEAQGDICRLTVGDNGPGIDPEHRELIFQPFKRLVGRGIEGTGLGLAICRRIAQMHGGSIWCEAENGPGATFILEVPLAEVRSTPPAASVIPHSAKPAEQPGEGSGQAGRGAAGGRQPGRHPDSEDQADAAGEGEFQPACRHQRTRGNAAARRTRWHRRCAADRPDAARHQHADHGRLRGAACAFSRRPPQANSRLHPQHVKRRERHATGQKSRRARLYGQAADPAATGRGARRC